MVSLSCFTGGNNNEKDNHIGDIHLENGDRSIEKTGNKVYLFVVLVARQIVRKLMIEVRNPGLWKLFSQFS